MPTPPYYESDRVVVHHGDCLDMLRTLDDNSVDAVVTDPPYGLEFMGKDWDAPWKSGDGFRRARNHEYRAGLGFQQWCQQWATECLRVLKPGGHMLAFGGTRTWHRLACAIEDAGFEIRDNLAWLYGSGFPKSLDVLKAIDKAAGAEREVVGKSARHVSGKPGQRTEGLNGTSTFAESVGMGAFITAPATPDAARWQGWGTALKPAYEPIVLARKPLAGTVASNVLAWGTGAINVDGCRIQTSESDKAAINAKHAGMDVDEYKRRPGSSLNLSINPIPLKAAKAHARGRWPANVVLDETAAAMLDEQSGELTSGVLAAHHQRAPKDAGILGAYGSAAGERGFGDSGGASRFFYKAKASRSERPKVDGVAHPTVKPLDVMRWLVRLVTPPGGVVLDPFAGSGTTVEACALEGFRCIAVERESDYLPLIEQRISRLSPQDDTGAALF